MSTLLLVLRLLFLGLIFTFSFKLVGHLSWTFTLKKIKQLTKETKVPIFNRISKSFKLINMKIDLNFIKREREKLLLIEEYRTSFLSLHIFTKYSFSILFIINGLIQRNIFNILLGGAFYFLPDAYIHLSKNKYEKQFQNHAYKLFKFMSNQREAGIPTSKVIAKLHHCVEDKRLKNRIISFSAEYIASNDYDAAFKHLSKYYRGSELRLLDSALRQGLQVGDNFVITDDAENLLFEKYLAYIDYETDKKKTQTILVAAIFGFSIILIVGYPIILETLSAFDSMFKQY